MQYPRKGRGTTPRRSPLYTSKERELVKRQTIRELGRDQDGAYRARRRKDSQRVAA